jgi:predicted Zn-dependent protease
MASPARYYDGVTAHVTEVGAKPGIGELLIYRPGDFSIVARWPINDIAVLGDSEHEAVPALALQGREARLVVNDPALRQQIAAAAPQLAALAAARPAAGRRIAQFGVTLAALLAVAWTAIDYGSEYAAPLVPHRLQAKLGQEVRQELIAGHRLCTNPAGLAAINGLANRLAKAAGHDYRVSVQVVQGGPVNAFTLPGDIMIFYSDLIDQARDGSQVAGVLAHEMGHVVHQHPIKGLVREYGTDFLLRQMTGGYSDVNALASGGGLLLALKNGRGFEREADATGVELLEKLGLRADGISTFFSDLMEKHPTDLAAAAGIWSSHPPTAERIAATRRPATGKPPFSEAEWQALKSICSTVGNAPGGLREPKRPGSAR